MATITEDYVNFETAKLLKEKGFDEPCHCLWNNPSNGSPYNSVCEDIMTYEDIDPEVVHHWYLCPTLQMAMKWLREKHNLWIDIDPLTGNKWTWSIWLMNDPSQKMGESLQIISNYNEACEVSIKYCLENLI